MSEILSEVGKGAELGTLAVTLFEFDGDREDMLSFKEGEVITIIEMNDNGWWKGTDVRGRVGIFPYSYVEVKITSQESFPYARAHYELPPNPEDPELLTFEKDEVITVMKEVDANWSIGRRANGDTGRFPLKYVELTGDFNEELFASEMEKWELLEVQMKKEQEKILQEKADLEKQFLKEQRDKKEAEMKQELDKIKSEADDLRRMKEEQEAEMKKMKEEMKRMREEMKRKENRAKKQLEKAQAEAAALRKIQERKDARKSVAIREKIGFDRDYVKRRINKVGNEFNGYAPGPPPQELTAEVLDIDEDPFADDFISKSKSKKMVPLVKPVYKDKDGNEEKKIPLESSFNVPTIEEKKVPQETKETPPPLPALPPSPKPKHKVLKKFANLGKGQACKTCGKSVGIANRVKACKGIYHDTCFRCATCNKIIRNGEYVDRNDNPYCRNCHKKGFGPKGFGFGLNGAMTTDIPAPEKKSDEQAQVVTESWV